MAVYSVRGFSAITGTADPMPICQLWNPDSVERIRVVELGVFIASAILSTTQNAPVLIRTTARGTAGSTVTPNANNCWDNPAAPPSGALLDLANFSASPTTAGPELMGWNIGGGATGGSSGLGWIWSHPQGIDVGPGTGLFVQATVGGINAWPQSECYFVWEEGA